MAISLYDSQMFGKAYGDADIARLFSDSAQIRAMLVFEGALAKVQAAHGLIPVAAADAIQRAALDVVIDPALLADGTAATGVPVPALVKAFRAAMDAPEFAQYVHWGATSQDVVDTGLMLRLRRVLEIFEVRLARVITALGAKATVHRQTPLVARTRSQPATYTTLGGRIASWGFPLLSHRERMDQVRPRLLRVSLGGASGNLSVMGQNGPDIADALADALALHKAPAPWHAGRDGVVEFAGLLALLSGSLGKMGQDMILMMREADTGFSAGTGGGSSTMPHKRNPVAAEQLVHLANLNANLIGSMHQSMVHAEERDGVAWSTEWAVLPQIVSNTGLALLRAIELAETIAFDQNAAERASKNDLIFAEACTFALSQHMPRPDAQALVTQAVETAMQVGQSLRKTLEGHSGELDEFAIDWDAVFDPSRQFGASPCFADRFVAAAKAAVI